MRRASRAAHTPRERRLFAAIVRRAGRDALELGIMANELEGVLAGDHRATERFRAVLEGAFDLVPPPGGAVPQDGAPSYSELGEGPRSSPCPPAFVVDPATMFGLTLGADRIAAGNEATYAGYLATLDALWVRTRWLDDLYSKALDEPHAGQDQFADELRLIARDLGPVDDRGPEVELADPSSFGLPPPDGDPWGPDDGPTLPWPPKKSGGNGMPAPPKGKPGEKPPPVPPDPCRFMRDVCRHIILGHGAELQHAGTLPVSTWSDTISSISPRSACAGATITIHGSGFGATQPTNVVVLIGNSPCEVLSWSDTTIVIRVPAGQDAGCVGFRDEVKEAERRAQLQKRGTLVAEMSASWECLGTPGLWPELPEVASVPMCSPFNYFAGTLPVIESFSVNGYQDVTVQPGGLVPLSWSVRNADTVTVRRASAQGAPLDLTNPPFSEVALGPWTAKLPFNATYVLTATNACGSETETVTVRLRAVPELKILGIEVIQTLQRFSLAAPSLNNSVRLCARKRTFARVYVESGLIGDFDYGQGPNRINVTGELTVAAPGGGKISSAGAPLNPGGVVAARPAAQISRMATMGGTPSDTLNFALPWDDLSGPLWLSATVRASDPMAATGPGWSAAFSGELSTFAPRGGLKVIRVIVTDSFSAAATPTIGDWYASLRGAIERYPIAEDGFIVHIAPGYESIDGTDYNLTKDEGWKDLIDDLDDIADDFEKGSRWLAVVPNDTSYALNGLAHPASPTLIGKDVFPCVLARATLPATMAHELAHTFTIQHAGCAPPGKPAPENVDPALPVVTELEGLQAGWPPRRIPQGTAELMSYCVPIFSNNLQDRWPSLVLWDTLFNAMAP